MEKKELIKLMVKPFTDPVTMFYAFALLALYVIVPQNCFAALPWETPLTMLQESSPGPVARLAASITVVVCGVMMAMVEGGQFGRTAIKLVMGLSLAILGNQFITAMFGK